MLFRVYPLIVYNNKTTFAKQKNINFEFAGSSRKHLGSSMVTVNHWKKITIDPLLPYPHPKKHIVFV